VSASASNLPILLVRLWQQHHPAGLATSFGIMDAGHEPDPSLHEVTVVGANFGFEPGGGWQSAQIYRHRGSVVEVWLGPSAEGPEARPACQLKQGTTEVAFIDLGGRRKLGRATGTIAGELVSFEISSNGIVGFGRAIEVRLAVKQELQLRQKPGRAVLIRKADSLVVAEFGRKFSVDSQATPAEATTAMLIHASGMLHFLAPPLARLLGKARLS
jgi:hypothetical protein